MVWNKYQVQVGSSSVDKDFKEILPGPIESSKNLVCIFSSIYKCKFY